jgi:ribose 5-phosphate isomerase RpiB
MFKGIEHSSAPRVKRVGIAADQGGFGLKAELSQSLRAAGYEIEDYGASGLALELVETFLHAHFSEAPRHQRRLAGVQALENRNPAS